MAKITGTTTTTTATADAHAPRIVKNTSGKGSAVAFVDGVRYSGLVLRDLVLAEVNGNRVLNFPNKTVEQNGEKKYFARYRIIDDGARKNLSAYINDLYENQENGTPVSTTLEEHNEGVKAYVTPYSGGKNPNLIGFARVLYNGVEIRDIMILTKKNDPEDAYIQFPAYYPLNKDGEHILTRDGNWYRKAYVAPATKEVAAEITTAVLEAYEKAVGGETAE